MTGKGEQDFMKLPLDKQTKNAPLLCRNLYLEVDGSWEKVENFTPFTAKDMAEMRSISYLWTPFSKVSLTSLIQPLERKELIL